VTLRDRDKKLIAAVVPAILIAAYWFVFLSPKRDEASKAGTDLAAAEKKRDDAVARAGQLTQARQNYANDYETVVRLGKAIPPSLDMPSLIVQLDRAARGTGIDFTKIKAGERQSASSASSASGGSSTPASGGSPSPSGASSGASSGGSSAPPAAAGGQQAQSGPGKAAEAAGNAANTAQSASDAAGSSSETNTQTSQNAENKKGLPVGGGDTSSSTAPQGSGVPGLDSVPLDFEFNGSFFDLADFFHRMKRFVRVVNKQIMVRGRLMTIDTMSFDSEDHFPSLKAEFRATVYLSPKDEGVTAGATPDGPPGATPASGGSPAPAGSPPAGQSASGAAPTAAVTR
jgi:Tfp pilus assembly protein PilO